MFAKCNKQPAIPHTLLHKRVKETHHHHHTPAAAVYACVCVCVVRCEWQLWPVKVFRLRLCTHVLTRKRKSKATLLDSVSMSASLSLPWEGHSSAVTFLWFGKLVHVLERRKLVFSFSPLFPFSLVTKLSVSHWSKCYFLFLFLFCFP